MADGDEQDLQAGDFADWLTQVEAALRGGGESTVPCGDCTACCTSFQFVHIAPDETDTLVRIPKRLLFPAPGRPRGHVVLGYDERGHCPMLSDGRCSIYAHRPRTCRTYDCRIFPAAGTTPGDDGAQAGIARQARRWRFDVATPGARVRLDAIRAAAAFLRAHDDVLADAGIPANATQLAVLAIVIHQLFLRRDDGTGCTAVVAPERDGVRAAVVRFARRT